MYKLLLLPLALLLSHQAFGAGPLIIGIRGGLPLNDLIDSNNTAFTSQTKMYTVGPTVGVNLPAGFAVTVDGLYKRFTLDAPLRLVDTFPTRSTAVSSWEFPVMVRWRAGSGVAVPFVAAGGTFRHWRDFVDYGRSIAGSDNDLLQRDYNTGFVFGGGLEFRIPGLTISPEVRVTRWNVDNFSDAFQAVINSNRNQAEFLVGLTF